MKSSLTLTLQHKDEQSFELGILLGRCTLQLHA